MCLKGSIPFEPGSESVHGDFNEREDSYTRYSLIPSLTPLATLKGCEWRGRVSILLQVVSVCWLQQAL